MRTLTWILTSTLMLGQLTACGKSLEGQVCSSAAARLFETCDKNNLGDVRELWNALQGMGVSISDLEIKDKTQIQVEQDCLKHIADTQTKVTDQDAKSIQADLKNSTTCKQTVQTIRLWL